MRKGIFIRFYLSNALISMIFLVCLYPQISNAQQNKKEKEQINIISSFKPSIVKTGKIEFDPKIPLKDTSHLLFVYPFQNFSFPSTLTAFSVKPLSFKHEEYEEVPTVLLKMGYGSLASPFTSFSWTGKKDKKYFTTNFDHFSATGKLPDQRLSQTAFTGSLKNRINENQSWLIELGFEQQAYRLYGFDHNLYSFDNNELKQHFNNIHFGTTYQQVSGSEGQTIFSPNIQIDYLIASRNVNEFTFELDLPFSYSLSQSLKLNAKFDFSTTHLNDPGIGSRGKSLIQLPLNADGNFGKLKWSGGVQTVLGDKKVDFAPNFHLMYPINNNGLRLKSGINNDFALNNIRRIYRVNPFILAPDSISVYRKSDYFVGLDWLNPTGLQLNFSMGLTRFNNIPLFVNSGYSERQFKVLQESSLSSFHLSAGLEYIFDARLKFRSEIEYFHFTKQQTYQKPFGLLPLEIKTILSWRPFDPISFRFHANYWRGSMALPVSNGNIGGGFPPFRLKDAADLGLSVDYKLNKKWALWLDLNNIANIRYQRWNKYESFGFHFIGGIKYVFNHSK